jgi:hypothetical protein
MRVFARMIDVERVVRMLNQRHARPFQRKMRNDLLNERRFTAAGPPCESKNSLRHAMLT